ncbi:hypothetical protein VKT23_011185 [Stygiomarasmius scandens]|uniref:Uncharacterized protein n=1 Tax=Marasmiellus scandens TaxID=2682957 RepID=A0ABR1JBD6_9AGAR
MPSIKLFPAMLLVGSALAVPVQQPTVNTCIVDGTDYTKNAFDVVKDIALATSLCPNNLSIDEFYKLLQKCCDDLNKIGKGTDGSVLGGYLPGIPESVGGNDGVSVGVPGNVQGGIPAGVSVGDSVGVPSTGNDGTGLNTHIGTPAGASLGGGKDTLGLGLGASGSSGVPGVDTPSAGVPNVGVPSVGVPSVGVPSVGVPSVDTPSVGNGGTGLDVGAPTGSGGLLSGLGIGKDTLGLGLDGSTSSNGSPLGLGVGTLGLGLGGTGSSGLGLGGLGDSLNIPGVLGAVDGAVPSLGGILSSPSSPSAGVSVPLTGAVDGAAPSVGGISVPSGSSILPGSSSPSSPSTGSGDCIENLCESLNGLKNTLVNKLTDCDGACYDQLSGSLLGWKKSTPDSDCKNNAPEGTKSTCSGTSDDGESICVYSTLNSAWWASKVDKTNVGVKGDWCCSAA